MEFRFNEATAKEVTHMNSVTQRIAAFTSALVFDQLPAGVREKSKVSLITTSEWR